MPMPAHGATAASSELPHIIEMSGVEFTWPGREAFGLTIEDFVLRAGQTVMLLGPSGSGKSTFLALLAGIVAPKRGNVRVLETELTKLSAAQRDRFRAEHVGVIFQMFNLLPYGTILDNVLLPLSFAPQRRARVEMAGGARAEAARLLSSLELDARLIENRSAASLSVGQQQRVAAARALIGRPEIILADEPTSALDRSRQTRFLDLLFSEARAAGATLIMVSHDESLAHRFDSVMHLSDIVRQRSSAGNLSIAGEGAVA